MPEIIMLVGAPCSGKSTWRRQNISQDYVVLDTDSYIEARAQEQGLRYGDIFDQEFKNAERDMQQRLRMAVAAGRNIVWDQTNLTRASRLRKLAQIPKFYARAAHAFVADAEVLIQRNLVRFNETGRMIPASVIRRMVQSFEMPTVDEGYDRGVQVDDLDEANPE